MKKIPLTKGKFVIVDETDFNDLNQHKWCLHSLGYAVRRSDGQYLLMHRVILGVEPGINVDHIDGDKLNNRRMNLRLCNQSQNCANRRLNRNNTSGYKGVVWVPRLKKFQAQIQVNRVNYRLGCHVTAEQAAIAYNKAAKKYFGDFSLLNKLKTL